MPLPSTSTRGRVESQFGSIRIPPNRLLSLLETSPDPSREVVKAGGRGAATLRPPPRQKVRVPVVLVVTLVVLVGLVPGFLLGLFAFRIKSRWCPRCGTSTDALRPVVRR